MWVNSAGTLMGFLARGSDGEESFDTVDTDYLSSRGWYNAWVNGRRWSVNGASDGAEEFAVTGPAAAFRLCA